MGTDETLAELRDEISALHTKIGENLVPKGTIVAWAGSGTTPSGWAICNGSNGTPDLRGLFLRGVGTLSETGLDSNAKNSHSHKATASSATGAGVAGDHHGHDDVVWTTRDHGHSISVRAASNIPENYRVLYIMKLG